MDFLKRMIATREAAKQSGIELYLTMVRKAADEGDLSPADTKRLEQAMNEIDLTPRDVETDVAALKAAAALLDESAGFEAAKAENKRCGREVQEHVAKYEKMVDDMHAETRRLEGMRGIAQSAMQTASRAGVALDALERQHPRLFPKTTPTLPAGTGEPIDMSETSAVDSAFLAAHRAKRDARLADHNGNAQASARAMVESAAAVAAQTRAQVG